VRDKIMVVYLIDGIGSLSVNLPLFRAAAERVRSAFVGIVLAFVALGRLSGTAADGCE
jgi:hypothetical protein